MDMVRWRSWTQALGSGVALACLLGGTAAAQAATAAWVGDCDGSGDVTISEIIVGVNIVLGTAPVAACRPS